MALIFARWRVLGKAVMPLAIAANAVPIIAFAPITNQWFGPLEKTSKMAIAAILVFFPVMVNSLRGLTTVHPSALELMRSYGAGQIQIFRRVRIPSSLPYLFTALKIATVLAMIGAIVGEYFLSSQARWGSRSATRRRSSTSRHPGPRSPSRASWASRSTPALRWPSG